MSDKSRWGCFPFGQPNTVRPIRMAGKTEVLVVGTYPSAWHVTWSAPSFARSGCLTGRVAAMAVDVEPTVFWNGDKADFTACLEKWVSAVRFRAGNSLRCDGYIKSTSPPRNGSSGAKLAKRYLAPVGIREEVVSFTDIFPVFMVKEKGTDSARGREQGDAIKQEYAAFADLVGRGQSTLPQRIQREDLPGVARREFGSILVRDILETRPSLVISLGEEVWRALQEWPSIRAQSPVRSFDQLCSNHYGSSGELEVDGLRIEWLPLIHPGQLGRRTSWDACHESWEARVAG